MIVPLAPDKIEIKREMLSYYQLKIADLYNIPIDNVKKVVPNFYDKEKYMIHYENLQLYLRLELKLKNISSIRIQSVSMAKTICWIQHKKRTEADKNGDKDGKALYKLMNHVVYGKTLENVRNRIDVKFVSSKKDYLKWTSKLNCMSHKIFYNNLVVIHKNKVTWTLNKPSYIVKKCLTLTIIQLSQNIMIIKTN